ncbi:MAG: SpaA isopeptide-forming pilin-related protein, partial [Chloroflexota bacterium]|nr:SpaA isopeptide-forming pilin-related protein [Chloroflexota bacterium]
FNGAWGVYPFLPSGTILVSDIEGGLFILREATAPPLATIQIVKDSQPDSRTNFAFTGDLGAFQLDDSTANDDVYTNTKRFSVAPGLYTVNETATSGWVLGAISCNPSVGSTVNLPNNRVAIQVSSGEPVTCTFINQKPALIRVQKYNDRNGNGRRNSGEAWLAGWTFKVYDAQDGLVGTQSTNNQGKVSFVNWRPGVYTVCEQLTAGWRNSQPGAINPTYGQPCYELTVNPGQTATLIFGNTTTTAGSVADDQSRANDGILLSVVNESNEAQEADNVDSTDDNWLNTLELEEAIEIYLPLVSQ